MKKYAVIWAMVATVLASCAGLPPRSPIGFWSRNRYHPADTLRHGPWREYFDAAEQHLANRGHYRHGLPIGRWQYYSLSGGLERREQFHGHSRELVTISYYHPDGRLAKRGQARYQITNRSVRFYWFGEWKCYSATGQPQASEFYRNGVKTATPITTPAVDSVAGPAHN